MGHPNSFDRAATPGETRPLAEVKALLTKRWPILLALFSLILIYWLETWTALRAAMPVFFIAALVLVIALPRKREKILAASICTFLILVDLFLPPKLVVAPFWVHILSHLLAIPLVWMVALKSVLFGKTQQALRDSEQRYQTLYEETPSMYFSVDQNGLIRSVNHYGATQLGYTREQLLGRPLLELYNEVDRPAVTQQLALAFRSGSAADPWEFRKIRKDGTLLWVREWVRIVKDNKDVTRASIVCEDITERKQTEQALRESERVAKERLAQLESIYTSAPVGLCFVNRELLYISMNDALAEMHGKPASQFLGKSVREATPEIARATEERCLQVIDTGKPVFDVEVRGVVPARPGEKPYWLASYHPVKDDTGAVLGVNVAVRDATYRKQAEADTLFLLDVGECIRFAADANEMNWAIAVALGEHLEASRCGFAEIDASFDRLTVRRDYHRHAPSLSGQYSLKDFSPAILDDGKAGKTVFVNDTARDERTAPHAEQFSRADIKAFVVTPLLRDGRLVACLFLAASEPRVWSEREVALVNAVAERTWLAAERIELVHALRQSEGALRLADRRKDEFLATLAHELRNPLGLIRNVVSLLESSEVTESEISWGRDIIDRQVNYLTRLTDDLFDVSRITRDKLELRKEVVQLAEIINGAVESCRPLVNQRGHHLTVSMPDTPIYVSADKIRLTQALMNLVHNAAKYTPSSGRIGVIVERGGDEIQIRVTDTGIGIAQTDLDRVFDLFFQADRSFARSEGGLGLGLTLVHRLVALHGGGVEAHSAGLDQGSEFVVRLPVIPGPPEGFKAAESHDPEKPSAPPRRRVLVADDFPESAHLLARLLRQDDNDVRVALDGLEAVETAAKFRPDIILLDIAMPKLDGYEAASRIRQQPWGKDVILIALTGWGQQQDRRRTKEAGFDVHLTKPVNYQAISKLLNDLSGEARSAARADVSLV